MCSSPSPMAWLHDTVVNVTCVVAASNPNVPGIRVVIAANLVSGPVAWLNNGTFVQCIQGWHRFFFCFVDWVGRSVK